jgi:hypothetical protein
MGAELSNSRRNRLGKKFAKPPFAMKPNLVFDH